MVLQLLVLGLGGKRLGPVECEIEMAAATIQFVDLATWRLVMVQDLAGGLVERFCQDERPIVLCLGTEILKRNGQGKKFAERVPAQVSFGKKLLDVFGCRTTRSRFE